MGARGWGVGVEGGGAAVLRSRGRWRRWIGAVLPGWRLSAGAPSRVCQRGVPLRAVRGCGPPPKVSDAARPLRRAPGALPGRGRCWGRTPTGSDTCQREGGGVGSDLTRGYPGARWSQVGAGKQENRASRPPFFCLLLEAVGE